MMNREELIELLPLYALGHLDPEEKLAVEALLRDDAEARQLLDSYRLVQDTFILGTPLRQAPAHLQADLRHRLAMENAAQGPTQVTRRPLPADLASQQPTQQMRKPALRSRKLSRPRFSSVAFGGVAAALLLVVALLAFLRLGDNPVREYAQIIAQSGAERIAVTSLENFGIQGELVISADRRAAVLALSNLPAVTDAQTLQLWLAQVEPPIVVSGGLFRPMPAEDGRTYLTLPLDRPVDGYLRFSVSLEAEGGSQFPDKPTGPRIVVVAL